MFDTLAVARKLAAGGVGREQAEVIAEAIRGGVEHGDHVTGDQFRAGLAEIRAEISALDTKLSTRMADLEARLIRWMVGAVLAAAGVTTAILRLPAG